MSKVNKKMIYCKHCGLELENGICTCGANFNEEKNQDVKKIKCDTCKKEIDNDSKFCPYCGVPVGTEVYNEELKRELRGDFEKDVLAYMKNNKQNEENGAKKEVFTPGMKKIIILGVFVLLLLFVVKGIMLIKNNIKKQQEQQRKQQYQKELLEDIADTADIVAETKTYYNAKEEEQKTIPIRDNWIRKNGYFYCLDNNGNPIIDDWVEEKDSKGKKVYYYFDIDGRLVVNSWIDDKYYVGDDGILYKDKMTPDGVYVDENGEIVKEKSKAVPVELEETKIYYELPQEGAKEKAVNQSSSSSGSLKGVDPNKNYELYIKEIRKIKESHYDDDKKYNITYYYPIIDGGNEEEVNTVNESVLDMFNVKFKDLLLDMKDEKNETPKSIILNIVEQRQVNSDRFIFIVSGKLAPQSGIGEKKTFRFVYDRKAKTIDMLDISNY